MKVRLNKTTLAAMPKPVRGIVEEWRGRYGKAFISVQDKPTFYAWEDSRVTMINLLTGASGTARAAGEFAGWTNLSPTAAIPLPRGVVAVEQGFYCGVPFLTVWQGTAEANVPATVN